MKTGSNDDRMDDDSNGSDSLLASMIFLTLINFFNEASPFDIVYFVGLDSI